MGASRWCASRRLRRDVLAGRSQHCWEGFFGDGKVPASLSWSGIYFFLFFVVCVSVMVMYDVISFLFW